MKDLMFILGLIILILLAIKIFLWALKSVVFLGIAVLALYLVFRSGILRKLLNR